MNLPPWNPSTDEERRAFSAFVIGELERDEEASVARATGDPFTARFLQARVDLQTQARELGMRVEEPPKKRGRPPAPPPRKAFDLAARDVPLIRAVFARHWPSKERRVVRPTAEEIAAERWDLSDDDLQRLTDRFQRQA